MSKADGQRRVLVKILRDIHEEEGVHDKSTGVYTLERFCPKCPDTIKEPSKWYK